MIGIIDTLNNILTSSNPGKIEGAVNGMSIPDIPDNIKAQNIVILLPTISYRNPHKRTIIICAGIQ